MVPPEIADLPFDAAFLMSLCRRAELAGKSPVRAERDEMLRFFAAISTKDFLDGDFQVVLPQRLEYAAKVSESEFMCFEESLLRGSKVRSMKRGAAEHAAHRKHL